MNESIRWIDEVRGNDSLRGAARKAGITAAKLIRQANDDMLTFETVRNVARAYGRSVISDLIRTGHLTLADAGVEGLTRMLQTASDDDLLLEIARRLEATSMGTVFDQPISEAISEAKVHRLPVRSVPTFEHDERAVAKKKSRDRGGDDGQG